MSHLWDTLVLFGAILALAHCAAELVAYLPTRQLLTLTAIAAGILSAGCYLGGL